MLDAKGNRKQNSQTLMWIGIDYGSKLAGTTVIAYEQGGKIFVIQSKKNEDADALILRQVSELKPDQIFLDAPLSVPGIYQHQDGFVDFFYRQCDRQLQAMSPMFLGGLTARAMKITAELIKKGIEVNETYPSALAKFLGLELEIDSETIIAKQALDTCGLNFTLAAEPKNRHQLDAILCYISGWRFHQNKHKVFGDEREGVITL